MNTQMPIGIDDFKEVREHYYFIDKTNLFNLSLMVTVSNLVDPSPPFRKNPDYEYARLFLLIRTKTGKSSFV